MTTPYVADATFDSDLAQWLAAQTWSNFAQSLAGAFNRYGKLTDRQAAAAVKMRATCNARRAAKGPRAPAPEAGFYFAAGSFYRVQWNRAKTHVYAKRWTGGEWEYMGAKPFDILTPDDIVTQADAAHFGHQFGRCLACNAELTDADSVERGFGPVCAKRNRWTTPKEDGSTSYDQFLRTRTALDPSFPSALDRKVAP